jgi:Holliday junction resolvase
MSQALSAPPSTPKNRRRPLRASSPHLYHGAAGLLAGDGLKGSIYERELKDILEGRRETVLRMGKRLNSHQRRCYFSTLSYPFVVIRAAGSLGMDLVALRGDVSFPIEVKSSGSDVFRFSSSGGKAELQAQNMVDQCAKSHLLPFYAYRLKGARDDPWRIFAMPLGDSDEDLWWLHEAHGTFAKLVMSKVPRIERTAHGARIMRWANGYPLSTFLEYLWVLCKHEAIPDLIVSLETAAPPRPTVAQTASLSQ